MADGDFVICGHDHDSKQIITALSLVLVCLTKELQDGHTSNSSKIQALEDPVPL
ncbi:hypothetical protein SK128_021191, partial [Halocaridina rubra]